MLIIEILFKKKFWDFMGVECIVGIVDGGGLV